MRTKKLSRGLHVYLHCEKPYRAMQQSPVLFIMTIFFLVSIFSFSAFASNKQPLPRFATTKSNEVNARSGPGVRYPTEWVFVRKGEPLEITAEFEQWRYVLDIKGEGGWVHSSVLSGKRSVVIKSKDVQELRRSTGQGARVVAKLSPDLRCQFKSCKANWCKIKCYSYEGWIEGKYLWGIYPTDFE